MSKAAAWQSGPHATREGARSDPAQFAEANTRRLPAWALSAGLHLAIMLALGLVVQVTPRGAAKEPDRTGGIVLVEQETGEPRYFTEADAATEAAAAATEAAPESPLVALPTEAPAVDVGSALPLPGDLPSGVEGMTSGALPNAAELLQSGRPNRQVNPYQVETGVFGVTGTGSKFVYVFDRSGSMNAFDGRPLAAAKAELVKSLASLDKIHQFQIIFYNDEPTIFNPFQPQRPKLMHGDSATKGLAAEFVSKVSADGGTRHLDALKTALAMNPDVIFFLTDADEPQLTHSELSEIRRRNARVGASINTIEFGAGPFGGSFNFLVRLATENGGRHAYVDVTHLPPRS
ncbi:MAG: hypothetical protein KDA62_18580 [Planctomycetales bacterium]|nr:hypothetical protein [Planctomycetales bacterium]